MEKTKIVVKIGLDPDVKEIITGAKLSVVRDGTVVQIRNSNDKIAEFDNLIYWRYIDEHNPDPDMDTLLRNLIYLDKTVDTLEAGLDTETLAWCIYAVQQFVEHKLVPGGPADVNSDTWSWEKFKDSFRPAVFKTEG